jgi:hypothetical protein
VRRRFAPLFDQVNGAGMLIRFLGWTLLGWVAALVCGRPPRSQPAVLRFDLIRSLFEPCKNFAA